MMKYTRLPENVGEPDYENLRSGYLGKFSPTSRPLLSVIIILETAFLILSVACNGLQHWFCHPRIAKGGLSKIGQSDVLLQIV